MLIDIQNVMCLDVDSFGRVLFGNLLSFLNLYIYVLPGFGLVFLRFIYLKVGIKARGNITEKGVFCLYLTPSMAAGIRSFVRFPTWVAGPMHLDNFLLSLPDH